METKRLARALVAAFNRSKPVRAGSLIITLYGDAVVPRGGSLSLADIVRIMQLFGIDSGHVRTAISRLTTDTWLERKKAGRNTFYRLSKAGEGEFERATKRIYFRGPAEPSAAIRLALLNGDTSGRAAQRQSLEAAGFSPFNAMAYVSADLQAMPRQARGIHVLDVPASDEATRVLWAAHRLDAFAARYRAFLALFGKLRDVLAGGAEIDDADALTVRLLLIQEFRRIVLRDPALPPSLLPAGWPGEAARQLAADIYAKVLRPSERQLDLCQADEARSLPKPNAALFQRFAAPQ